MTPSTRIARARHPVDGNPPASGSTASEWIGINVSSEENARRMRGLLPLLLIALVAALGVSSLRIELIRVRYAMATALKEEDALLGEQRRLIVHRLQLRDPVDLAIRARALGFRPHARALSLPEPTIPGLSLAEAIENLPAVGARPATVESGNDWQ